MTTSHTTDFLSEMGMEPKLSSRDLASIIILQGRQAAAEALSQHLDELILHEYLRPVREQEKINRRRHRPNRGQRRAQKSRSRKGGNS